MANNRGATIEDLHRVDGKAELVNGELVLMSAAGYRHGCIALRIAASLLEYEKRTGRGHARADYFAAGTEVVWDVDPMRDKTVPAYRASDPGRPSVYRRGELARAEPALPGWSIRVDDLFAG